MVMPCPVDTECEECMMPLVRGEYVNQIREDDYIYYIHEVCPDADAEVVSG